MESENIGGRVVERVFNKLMWLVMKNVKDFQYYHCNNMCSFRIRQFDL